jgi:hypothetical protein
LDKDGWEQLDLSIIVGGYGSSDDILFGWGVEGYKMRIEGKTGCRDA